MRRLPLLSVFFALVLVLGLGTSACGNTIRPAAATINGTDISQSTLDDELEAIQHNTAYVQSVEQGGFAVTGKGKGTLSNDFVGRVLTRQIFLLLVHEEVVRKKLSVSSADIARAEDTVVGSVGGKPIFDKFPRAYQQTLKRRNAEVTKLQGSFGGDEVTEASIKAFYDANPQQFAQTCVSHILFAVTDASGQIDQEATAGKADELTPTATAARAELAGGADFSVMAAARSVDNSNKDQGGDLECGGPGRFVAEFENAMDALQVGEISAPVKTQFGVHLIKVTDRKPQSLEEATPAIQQQLQSDSQAAFTDFLRDALAKAKISVNPRYGRFSKDGQSPGIIPPGAPTTTVPGGAPPPQQPFGP
ncbi:MAG TPA: peptidylprolyl isomerase [Acidimicrobiales bacterium]|nr:peptidylprolyl isomerase [Acidimicrobiales bacterium]